MPRNSLLLLLSMTVAAAPLKNYTCASCHREEARTQPQTPMGIGIQLPPDQTLLKTNPKLTFEKNGYKYAIERKGDHSTYTVTDGTATLTLPIRYAFGVHSQTFVLEHEGRFYESMVSYYQPVGGLAITMGDEQKPRRNLVEAMGVALAGKEAAACFACHSSGAVSHGELNTAALKPGLDCEHCHPGANAHMEALAQGKQAPLPRKLGQLAAEDMSNFCGACHRTWDTVLKLGPWGQVNVRFQPYRLANSKCFLGDDRRIGCTACHDPHAPLVRDESSYDAKCLACHQQQKPCPVSKDKCTVCHMPKVELPRSHANFTDHYIRVVRKGDPYPN